MFGLNGDTLGKAEFRRGGYIFRQLSYDRLTGSWIHHTPSVSLQLLFDCSEKVLAAVYKVALAGDIACILAG
jgi:hypothetical protein